MPITSSDIKFYLSVKTGSAGASSAGTPSGSLGKYVSTTAITTAVANNLFDDVSGAEAAAGMTDYRCIFIQNDHATLTLQNCQVSIGSQTSGGGDISIALDNIATSAKGSASAQAAEIANETTAPSGTGAFGTSALNIGSLAPGQVKAVWLRRVVGAGAGATNDGVILNWTGDTAP